MKYYWIFVALLVFVIVNTSYVILSTSSISNVLNKILNVSSHNGDNFESNTDEGTSIGVTEHSTSQGKRKQPHILLIITDDQGYNSVGYNGGTSIKTPVIDHLAKTGVILNNYYVQPICTPTRGQLFSGRHQIHTGLYTVISPGMSVGLPLDSPTLADKLKEAGYSTNLVGKWHIGCHTRDHLPTRRGFDSFFGIYVGHSDHFDYTSSSYYQKGFDLHNGENPANMAFYNGKYSTKLFADKAIDIIENHDSDKPLFLVVAFTAPHSPHQVPRKYRKACGKEFGFKSTERIYAGMISCIDEAVGNITNAFKRKGLWSDTVTIYTSDNGAQGNIKNANYPLRGHKGGLFEGGIKVPGFVHSDLLQDSVKGTISKELLHVTDWFPTLVGLGQGNLNNTKQLYGHDVRKTIFNGERSPRNEILHDISVHRVSEGDALFNNTFDTRIKASLRIGDWKILTGYPGPYPKTNKTGNLLNLWLFNITNDPLEKYDLSSSRPDLVKTMLDRLEVHRKNMVPGLVYKVDRRSFPKYHNGFWEPWM